MNNHLKHLGYIKPKVISYFQNIDTNHILLKISSEATDEYSIPIFTQKTITPNPFTEFVKIGYFSQDKVDRTRAHLSLRCMMRLDLEKHQISDNTLSVYIQIRTQVSEENIDCRTCVHYSRELFCRLPSVKIKCLKGDKYAVSNKIQEWN